MRAVLLDPLLKQGKACGFDATGAYSPNFLRTHEIAFFEDLKVLADGSERDAERPRQSRDSCGPPAQLVKNGAASRVAERVEEAVNLELRFGHCSQSACQFFSKAFEQTAPALFDHLRSIGPVDEGSLIRKDQVGAGLRR